MSEGAGDWSRRAVLVGLIGVSACARQRGRSVDVSLPDGAPVDVGTPFDVLSRAAADREPLVRAQALAGLVRGLPEGEVVRWSTQGTYDPDPWVQQLVLQALVDRGDGLGRAQVQAAWARRSTDAYAVGAAMHRLMDEGVVPEADSLDAVWPDARPWDAAPRALVAWRAGVQAAAPVLQASLGSGLVREDPAFLGRMGAHGDPSWAADARRGADRIEELATALDFVRAVWGDRDALRAWTLSLRDPDPFVARTAFDLALGLPDGVRATFVAQGRKAKDPAVKRAASAWAHPSRGTIQRALGEPGAFAGEVALRATASLSEADRRAVLAVGLTHPQEEVLLAAVAQVRRLAVPGLGELLAPLTTHPSAIMRAAVAGAALATDGG